MISRKNEHIESLKQQFLDYESTFSYLPEETGKTKFLLPFLY